jgi:hypothetical protein
VFGLIGQAVLSAAGFSDVIALASAYLSLGGQSITDMFDDPFYEELKCLLYQYCPSNGVWDETAYNNLVDALSNRSGTAWLLTLYFIRTSHPEGLNHAAQYFDPEDTDCSDCDQGDLLSVTTGTLISKVGNVYTVGSVNTGSQHEIVVALAGLRYCQVSVDGSIANGGVWCEYPGNCEVTESPYYGVSTNWLDGRFNDPEEFNLIFTVGETGECSCT